MQRRLRNFNVPGMRSFRRRRLGVTTEERRLCLSAIAEHGSDTHNKNLLMRKLCAAFRIWKRTWRALTGRLCDPYRPEQRNMRGPSPKYRAQGIECNVKTPVYYGNHRRERQVEKRVRVRLNLFVAGAARFSSLPEISVWPRQLQAQCI